MRRDIMNWQRNLDKKLGEYGNNTLFIFVDVSGKRTIANETIAAILCHADMIQIKEGYENLKRAETYLKRLAEKTGIHRL